MTAHTYTADMNMMHVLPSGNWFTSFVANTKTHTVSCNYCDRRRSGQVARRYIIRFESDNSTVRDIIAISAQGGRVEMFKSSVVRETAANILRRGLMVEFEESLEQNEQAVEPAKEEQTVTTIIVETLVSKMNIVVAVFAMVAFVMTLIYFLFGGVSTADAVMSALIGAEMGALVALFAGNVAMDVKHRK